MAPMMRFGITTPVHQFVSVKEAYGTASLSLTREPPIDRMSCAVANNSLAVSALGCCALLSKQHFHE